LIIAAGNVGIGTTNPNQKLNVVGNIKGNQLCIGNDCRTSWSSLSLSFGSWQDKSFNKSYRAEKDEFVVIAVFATGGSRRCSYSIYSPINILRQFTNAAHDGVQASLMSPVRKGDTWIAKKTRDCGGNVYWIPLQ